MPRKPRRAPPPAECPNCGESFPAGRPACPHCGSDAETGWQDGDEVDYRSADVPDTFDEEAYRQAVEDLGPRRGALRSSRRMRNLVIGGLLLAALIVPALVALWRLW